MGYYNLPPGNKVAEKLSDLEQLLRSLPLEGAFEALDLLEKLLRNVVQNPGEEKFRRVRTTNEKLAPLFKYQGAVDIMKEMEWQVDGEWLVLPMAVKLDFPRHITKVLEAKSWYGKERERAARSQKLGQDPAKAHMLMQLELDRRERAAAAACRQMASAEVSPLAEPAIARDKGPETDEEFARRLQAEEDALGANHQASQFAAPVATLPTTTLGTTTAMEAGIETDEEIARRLEAEENSVGHCPAAVPAPPTVPKGASSKPTAYNFERREKKEETRQNAQLSLQELRAMQKEKYQEFQSDPNAKQSAAYSQPASVSNGGQEAGWFDWLWGGGSSSSGGGGGGSGGGGGGRGSGGDRKPRIRGVGDLPQPIRRGG